MKASYEAKVKELMQQHKQALADKDRQIADKDAQLKSLEQQKSYADEFRRMSK